MFHCTTTMLHIVHTLVEQAYQLAVKSTRTLSMSIPVILAILSFSGWPSLRKFFDMILLT